MKRFVCWFFSASLFMVLLTGCREKVVTLDIPSAVMKKNFQAVVVLPESYASTKTSYPVLYLLHGGFGHYNDWLTKLPDKTLLHRMADQYNLIIVMPEGETFSYYLNSPIRKDSQFETYITKEVISKIDSTYRTARTREGRVISGLSLGGHGALYLSAQHPDLYCAAGSMSGALNPDMKGWKLPPNVAKDIKLKFEQILGSIAQFPDRYAAYSVLTMTDQMKANGLNLIIDCGLDDALIEPNRELHRRLVANQTTHTYSERPGGHSWKYWQSSLPNHVLFFHNVLKANGAAVQ